MPNLAGLSKDQMLLGGMLSSTAVRRLQRRIIFSLAVECSRDECFVCSLKIETAEDISIEHKQPWRRADKPVEAFFDLNNIAFSHRRCNTKNGKPLACPWGHEYTEANTYINSRGAPVCRTCRNRSEVPRG